MTGDRMEPTMQLRWVRRPAVLGQIKVLQQLWVQSPRVYQGEVICGGEWRDVPVVEG